MRRGLGLVVLLVVVVGVAAQDRPERASKPQVSGWAARRVAVPTETGDVYVGWRLLKDDPADIAFDVYRSGDDGRLEQVNAQPIVDTTDFVDVSPVSGTDLRYWVCAVRDGDERAPYEQAVAADQGTPYVSIELQGEYTFQKAGIADLNGDGRYDFVIKQPDINIDPEAKYWNPSEGTYKIEAYLGDGTFLWRNDLGWSIEWGIWYSPYVVYDLDGDGKAEVAVKTGEGDPRDADGRVTSGPEYVSIWDGMTGEEKARVDWPSREGMGSYDPTSRNQLGIAYLDGKTPCLLVARGTYGLMKLVAYQYHEGRLEELWRWESKKEKRGYHGQGAHFMHTADVDGDGRDEVILGSCVIDDNGRGLWTVRLGHPDHCYVGDIDPARPGLEIYYGIERPRSRNAVCLVDASTGSIIWGIDEPTYHVHDSGLCADFDSRHRGMECYSGERDLPKRWLHAADGTLLATQETFDVGVSPRAVYWDADPQRELLHNGRIFDFGSDTTHLAGVAGGHAAWADVLGDWREEIVTSVKGELRIYTTAIPATDRRVCLMQDPIHRLDVAHLAMGYPQPPMTSFCPAEPAR
jgi:rhamnogalacturonan endolyase